MENRTPYRLQIGAKRYFPVGKPSKKTGFTRIELRHIGFDAWTEVQAYQEARLPSAGSFLFPGIHAVRREAMRYLSMPGVHQVQVRTNQDRKVYLFNKWSDGRISGYVPD